MISATTMEIHIPSSLNNSGRHSTAITWKTSVLRKAINAETNPSFKAVKNDDPKMENPENKKQQEYI